MYSDDESDDEYYANGHHKSPEWPPTRLLQEEERNARGKAAYIIFQERTRRPSHDSNASTMSKQLIRQFSSHPTFELKYHADWRRWRFFRFFLELQGFHKGHLDLSARSTQRYNRLKRTWLQFIRDYNELLRRAGVYPIQHREDWVSPIAAEYAPNGGDVKGHELWTAFYRKWSISGTIDPREIFSCVARTLEVTTEFREPGFQSLYFVSLPPEVVGLVYFHAETEGARRLSATCRYLRDAGRPYIFLSRKLLIEHPYVRRILGQMSNSELRPLLWEYLSESLSACIDDTAFLISRTDICSWTKDLEIGSRWPRWLANMVEDECALQFANFTDQLAELLARLRLRRLTVHGLLFDTALARRFAEQSALRSCTLYDCSTTAEFREGILHLLPDYPQSPLQSLEINVYDDDASTSSSIWPLLAFCSSLRLLHVHVSADSELPPPEEPYWPRLSVPLNNLEYLWLEGVQATWDLVGWFEVSATLSPMRITHLKLEFVRCMPDHFTINILRSLHAGNAPLEVLVLDGIMPASVELVDTIAQLFPALVALTLCRRAGKRPSAPQYGEEKRRSRWESPLHAYAAPFRNFTRLRHFAANFYWDYEALSPLVLDNMLNEIWETEAESEEDSADLFEDAEDLARPFAAYCPTLRTFHIEYESSMPWPYLTITRSATGAIVMELSPRVWGGPLPGEHWDPDSSRPWTLPPHPPVRTSLQRMSKKGSRFEFIDRTP